MRLYIWFCAALSVLGLGLGLHFALTGLPDVGIILILLSVAVVPACIYMVRRPRQWGRRGAMADFSRGSVDLAPGQALLSIQRPPGYPYAVLRQYKIEVDGRVVAKLKRGQTVSIPLEAGQHTVRARIDWGSSSAVHLQMAPGDDAKLSVTPGPPIAAFTRPSETLVLQPSR